MEVFKSEFEYIMRRLFCLLPSELAFSCVSLILCELFKEGYISDDERNNLVLLSKAYLDILGG